MPGAAIFPEGPTPKVSASTVRDFSRLWTGRLAHYRLHRNPEHLEALLTEALRFTGLHMENELSGSSYWSKAPLARRVALLLYLVDKGVVTRVPVQGRVVYVATEGAAAWAACQPSMTSYLVPTLEFLAAMPTGQSRQSRPARP